MEVYLENAREKFMHSHNSGYYQGRGLDSFENLLLMLGHILPNKVTPEELIVYLKFLIKDLKEENCGFKNSKQFKELFKKQLLQDQNVDYILTYFPNFIQLTASVEFNAEFLDLFNKAFYQKKSENEDEDYGCIEIKENVIDISNKDKAEVLAKLYNNSKPLGMGIVQYDPREMPVEIARQILDSGKTSFDYLKGRVMKINLAEDIIYVSSYNRDNDYPRLAQKVISTCKNINKEVKQKKK